MSSTDPNPRIPTERPGPPSPLDALQPARHLRSHEVPVIVRGEGAYVWDQHGKRYLDGLAGLFTSQIGHGRTELAEAGAKQASTLAYFPLWTYAHPRAIELAERIARYAPGDLNRVFFTSGGSEAVESAWKLARQYFRMTGQPQRTKVISRDIAYHGTTMGALSITGHPGPQDPFRTARPRGDQCPQHQLLPGRALRRRRGRLRPVGRRRDRAGHAPGGARHHCRRLPRAGAERRRLLPAPAGLLRAGPRDLRPPRGAPGLRRGDLRLRPSRPLVRLGALRLPARHHHRGQGPHVGLRTARRHDRLRPPGRALPGRGRVVPARLHVRRAPGELCRRPGQPRRLRG